MIVSCPQPTAGAAIRKPRRDVHGVLILDKPLGLTSNAALQRVRGLFGARKAGHTGSLDPLATGVLPICLGEATKLSGELLDAPKRYRVSIVLGVRTTTGDAGGEVTERRPVENVTAERVADAIAALQGNITQVPPMYSALKHKGQRLYTLAQQGIEVEREPRPVTVYEALLVAIRGSVIEAEFHCSKGTYVRTLAEDLGNALGCGAHVGALRRTLAGRFGLGGAVTIDALTEISSQGNAALDTLLIPPGEALAEWPSISLSADQARAVCHGQAVSVGAAITPGRTRIFDAGGAFLGLGDVGGDGRLQPKRLLHL